MEKKKRVTLSWSGGKDSALALKCILNDPALELVSLHTVINFESRRVGMHGVREELVEAQAHAIGVPLRKIYTEAAQTHDVYEEAMSQFFQECAVANIQSVVYGDIFLEDLKDYRERLLQPWNLQSMYPLWQRNTTHVIEDFISAGFKTVLCVVNDECFQSRLLGKIIDNEFLGQLPAGADPCGERGEFHTFVYDGPFFQFPIPWRAGDQVSRTYDFSQVNDARVAEKQTKTFWFQDLLLNA